MEVNEFGFWSESSDLPTINCHISKLTEHRDLINDMGQQGYNYMNGNYTVTASYLKIINHFNF